MREPRKGEVLVCANGHEVGVVVRDVGPGDMNWGDAFEWHIKDAPVLGSMDRPKCEVCGAEIFKGHGWEPFFKGEA